MSSKNEELKVRKKAIIAAGYKAVDHLIKVAEEKIITDDEDKDISADRLKNAAATKKLAIFDAFEILNKIESEKNNIEAEEKGRSRTDTTQGFAERRAG